MISDVTAAVGLVKFHAFLPQHVLAGQQMLALPISSLGDYVRMLANQKHILDRLGLPRRNNSLLQCICFRVADQPNVDLERSRHSSLVITH
jgi:hypothetical protein